MLSGIGRLAAVISAQRGGDAGELFFARVTETMALDDGCGVVIPAGAYLMCEGTQQAIASAPDSEEDVNMLCAWVGAQAVAIAQVK